jgi:hypothetical protein
MLQYDFNTAWSPAIPIIEEASKVFPMVKFTLLYAEQGADFSGSEVWKNGEQLESEDGAYGDVRGSFYCDDCGEEVPADTELYGEDEERLCRACVKDREKKVKNSS